MAVDDLANSFDFISKAKKRSMLSLPPPFDRGEKLIRANLPLFLGVALPPFIIDLLVSYMRYYSPGSFQLEYVFSVAVLLTTSWITFTLSSICIDKLRGKDVRLLTVGVNSLQLLPKVVFSYIALLITIVYAALNLPYIGFLCMFLIWAPIYCAGESFSTENIAAAKKAAIKKRQKDDDEEGGGFFGFGGEGVSDRDDLGRSFKKPEIVKWFSARPIWDLGFARAFNFSSKNPLLTLQFFLLFWAVSIFPGALVATIAGVHTPFAAEVISLGMSAVLRVFVVTLGVVDRKSVV